MKTKERKVDGEDEFGNYIYGVGYIYYWGDIGWLLGPNLYTYSYWSDGKEGCVIFKKNWIIIYTTLTIGSGAGKIRSVPKRTKMYIFGLLP